MSKILFLDFDGVLNPYLYSNYLTKLWSHHKVNGVTSRDKFGDYFAPWCVDELSNIVAWTGCDIVVISTWRAYMDPKYMWEYRRLPGKCVGATPVGLDDKGPEITRGLEVKAWCEKNGMPDKYAIIDDNDEFTGVFGGDFYIQTNPKHGLTRKESEKAINLLID